MGGSSKSSTTQVSETEQFDERISATDNALAVRDGGAIATGFGIVAASGANVEVLDAGAIEAAALVGEQALTTVELLAKTALETVLSSQEQALDFAAVSLSEGLASTTEAVGDLLLAADETRRTDEQKSLDTIIKVGLPVIAAIAFGPAIIEAFRE